MMIEQNTNYAYKLKYMDNPTFDKVRELSTKFYRELPQALQDELFEALNRGIDILDSEPQMTAYLFAFGKMHKAKLNYAFEHLPETFFEIPEINIIDYGCGQAVATMCYADFLRRQGYKQKIRRVTLIEPSEAALKRAALHISVFFPDAEIVTINKGFDDLETKDIVCDEDVPTLHLLSNVLDMECFSLAAFMRLLNKTIGPSNMFVCVGPYFGEESDRSKRMDWFNENLMDDGYFVDDLDAGKFDANNSWTCMVRCFGVGDLDYSISDENLSTEVTDEDIENGIMAMLLRGEYCVDQTYTINKGIKVIIINKGIKVIGNSAFCDCNNLKSIVKSIVIPKSVKSIGEGAFCRCWSLQSIIIPNSVKSIGDYAFSSCTSLQSIVIPSSVKSIGEEAFSGCKSLQSIVIPNSVKSIGEKAFSGCESLQSIVIPNSVKSIGEEAFEGCLKLTSIIVEPYNETYDSRSNCNAIIEKKTNKLVAGCSATIIPNSVKSIGDYAFRHCESLQSIVIPNSVTSIGERAFYDCESLQSIIISNSMTTIGEGTFCGCWSLQSIIIPNSVKNIGKNAFYQCTSLQSIIISNNITCVEECTFRECYSLQSVVIPNSVTSIGDEAFGYCDSLQSIVIPNSVTSIGDHAFTWCRSLQSIIIPNSVTIIGKHAFNCCESLQSIVIPKGRKSKFRKMLDKDLWDKLVEK